MQIAIENILAPNFPVFYLDWKKCAQLKFTSSKSTIETVEKSVKYVQS